MFQQRNIFFGHRISTVYQVGLHQTHQHTGTPISVYRHISYKGHLLSRGNIPYGKVHIAEQGRHLRSLVPVHHQTSGFTLVESKHLVAQHSLTGQSHVQVVHVKQVGHFPLTCLYNFRPLLRTGIEVELFQFGRFKISVALDAPIGEAHKNSR